jgi:protein TonB
MTEKQKAKLKKSMPKNLVALLWMLVGSLAVFTLVMTMNSAIARPKAKKEKKTVAFDLQKTKKKNRKMKVRRRQQPKRKSVNKANRAPLPKISGSLGGMSFGIPDFDASAVGQLSDKMLGSIDNLVMSEEAVDKAPQVRSRTEVAYPARARSKGITGFVTLSLLITDKGDVERVKILEAQPDGVFEEAALEAVRDWKFEPATYKGKTVKVWARQRVQFKLI